MLDDMRFAVTENIDYSSLPSNYEINKLDEAQDDLCDELLKVSPLILASYFDLTLDGSMRYYISDSIPYDYETILMITDIDDDANSPTKTVVTAWHDRLNVIDDTMVTDRIVWSIIDNNLELPNQETSGTLRVWYTRRPVGFFYGLVGAGSTTLTVTFPATPVMGELIPQNDYYNGMKVYVNGQIRRITDYVASTKVATITPAWTTTPVETTDTVELISPLPAQYHKTIVNRAIQSIKLDLDDDDSGIAQKIAQDENRAKSRLGKRQRQMPETVRHIDRF